MQMYVSTRDESIRAAASQAVLKGIADDGGLFMLPEIPKLDLKCVIEKDARGISKAVLTALMTDFTAEEISAIVDAAYKDKFETVDLTPTVAVGDAYVLELFRGPTSAFKDVALSVLPHLITASKVKNGVTDDILILTATSGDTGKAALAGFCDVPGTRIIVFYPESGVSAIQKAQMVTQVGKNVAVCAIRGNFDDSQTGVKNIFTVCEHDSALLPAGVRLSSANSINIGRLAPQVMYYFKAYKDIYERGEISQGEKIDFCVPTGNFGDILAGFIAKRMGLPVGRFVCASNSNDVLDEFIRTGHYDKRREFFRTASPSMDILISSNLERLLYMMSDAPTVRSLMESLKTNGEYTVTDEMRERISSELVSGHCSDRDTAWTIDRVYREHGYLMDTHTAVAWRISELNKTERPMVVLSTASPFKFSPFVLDAIGGVAAKDEFEAMDLLNGATGVRVPQNLSGLKDAPVLHTDVTDTDEMLSYVLRKAGEKTW